MSSAPSTNQSFGSPGVWRPDHYREVDHPPADAMPQRAPARTRSSPGRSSSLPRTRRRPHNMDLPHMRSHRLRAAAQYALHRAGRACNSANLEPLGYLDSCAAGERRIMHLNRAHLRPRRHIKRHLRGDGETRIHVHHHRVVVAIHRQRRHRVGCVLPARRIDQFLILHKTIAACRRRW